VFLAFVTWGAPLSKIQPIVQGLDYQYRHFWVEAARLLYDDSPVHRVALEHPDVPAWDDVVSFYKRQVPDYYNRGIEADHFQLKFHVDGRDVIQGEDLADPRFIGTKSHSLLERLAAATNGGSVPKRFTLITSWQIDQSDALYSLISGGYGPIRLDRLFEGGPQSAVGKLRDNWRASLGLSNIDDLRPLLSHLAIHSGLPTWMLETNLECALVRAHLKPVDIASARHSYADLARAFIDRDDIDFDAAHLREVCDREGLFATDPSPRPANGPRPLAVASFVRYAAHLEDEADALDLVPWFTGRSPAPGMNWDTDILPELEGFLGSRVKSGGQYDLHLDCHLSLGYAAGYLLSKSGADVAPVQGGGQQRFAWRPSNRNGAAATWEQRDVALGRGKDVAVAIEVAQSVQSDVEMYCRAHLPEVGRLLVLSVPGGPGRGAIRDADHAKGLAIDAIRTVRGWRTIDERSGRLHLFAAIPNGLMFFLGEEGPVLGPTTIYEYDFDAMRPGGYQPGLSLPRGAGN
jgi:hypothetical protein